MILNSNVGSIQTIFEHKLDIWLSCLAFSGRVALHHVFNISRAVGRTCCIVSMHPGSDLRIKAAVWRLFSFFTGASADVKVAFDESVSQDLIRSMPFVNMSSVPHACQHVSHNPPWYRPCIEDLEHNFDDGVS